MYYVKGFVLYKALKRVSEYNINILCTREKFFLHLAMYFLIFFLYHTCVFTIINDNNIPLSMYYINIGMNNNKLIF